MILRSSVFTGLTPGTLLPGNLWFDADGTGAAAAQLFAVLDNLSGINASDFEIL